jgi:predicted CXXCH cytochrome family protein
LVHKIRVIMACLASVALLAILGHRVLVRSSPSGDSPSDSSDSNSASISAKSLTEAQFSHDSPDNAQGIESSASPHGPLDACDNCHDSKTPDESKAHELAQQVPKLCFRCHEDESKIYPHVHGPVAVGQCLFCHDPHQSKHAHLLIRDTTGLCALCHTKAGLRTIKDHLEPSHAQCLACHNSHASTTRFLLKRQQDQAEEVLH